MLDRYLFMYGKPRVADLGLTKQFKYQLVYSTFVVTFSLVGSFEQISSF